MNLFDNIGGKTPIIILLILVFTISFSSANIIDDFMNLFSSEQTNITTQQPISKFSIQPKQTVWNIQSYSPEKTDKNTDGIRDVITKYKQVNDSMIELQVYLTNTAKGQSAFKWGSAVCSSATSIEKWEINANGINWTSTGNLNYAKLSNYGLPSTWCNQTANMGYVLFGGGSGNKTYRLNINGDKQFTLLTGEGTEEIFLAPTTQQQVVLQLSDSQFANATCYRDVYHDGTDWSNSINDLVLQENNLQFKYGFKLNNTQTIERVSCVVEADTIIDYKGASMFTLPVGSGSEYILDHLGWCDQSFNGSNANCSFTLKNKTINLNSLNGNINMVSGSVLNITGFVFDVNGDGLIEVDPTYTFSNVSTTMALSQVTSEANTVYHLTINDTSLKGYWSFDDPIKAYDHTANNNDGTITGTTTINGKYGNAYTFDGVDDVINIADSASLEFGDGTNNEPFTISAWVKRQAGVANNKMYVVGKSAISSTVDYSYDLQVGNERIVLQLRDDSSATFARAYALGLTLNDSNWHYITATFDGSEANEHLGIKLYLDGISETIDSSETEVGFVAMENLAVPLLIASRRDGTDGSPTQTYFNGSIDEVAIWNRVLTTTEINNIFNQTYSKFYQNGNMTPKDPAIKPFANETGINVVVRGEANQNTSINATVWYANSSATNSYNASETSLKTYYHADNANTDASGNSNTLTLNNGMTYSGNRKFGSASFELVGDNDYGTSAGTVLSGATQGTFCGWFFIDVWEAWNGMIGSRKDSTSGNYTGLFSYDITQASRVGFIWNGVGPYSPAGSVPTGNWTHICGVYNSTRAIVYVDGAESAYRDQTSAPLVSNRVMWVGADEEATGDYFNGQMDELMVLNRALTPKEVKDLYLSGSMNHMNNGTGVKWTKSLEGEKQLKATGFGTFENVFITDFNTSVSHALVDVELISNDGSFYTPYVTQINMTTTPTYPWNVNVKLNTTNMATNDTTVNLTASMNYTSAYYVNETKVYNWYKNGTLNASSVFINDPSLVAYYPFDNNAKTYKSNSNRDGIFGDGLMINDSLTDSIEILNRSVVFDGTGDDIQIINPILPVDTNAPSNFSIVLWLKFRDITTGTNFILDQARFTEGAGDFILHKTYNNLEFARYEGSALGDTINTTLDPNLNNTWLQLGVTWQGGNNGTRYIYINGQLATTVTNNDVVPYGISDTDFFIGGAGGGLRFFNGSMDELQIYNRTLSPTEIDILYRGSKTNGRTINESETFSGDLWKIEATVCNEIMCSPSLNSSSILILGNDTAPPAADTTAPTLILSSPANNTVTMTAQQTFIINATDNINLTAVNITIYNSTGLWYNSSLNITGLFNSSEFTATFNKAGVYTWNATAQDNSSNIGYSTTFTITYQICPASMNGSGTLADPCQITTVEQLQNMSLGLGYNYSLRNNIDATATKTWNSGAGFIPVGTFTGSLAGNNKTITGLYIRSSGNTGLFSSTQNPSGTITSLGLVDVNISGTGTNTGALIGSNAWGFGGTAINQVYVTGWINGSTYVGGLVGQSYGATYTNNYINVNVTGATYAGGIVGLQNGAGSIISNSYTIGYINSTIGNGVGRFIGFSINGGTLSNVASNATIQGNNGGHSVTCSGVYWLNFTGTDNLHECSSGSVPLTNNDALIGDVYPSQNPYKVWSFFDIWKELNGQFPVLAWQGTGSSFDTRLPNISITYPADGLNITNNPYNLRINSTVTDAGALINVSLELDGSTYFRNTTGLINGTYSQYLSLSQGNNTYKVAVRACDTSGNCNVTLNRTIYTYYKFLDTHPPNYSNLQENPSDPQTYAPGVKYEFNATWQDFTGIDTVLFELDHVNYTPTQNGNVYNITFISLPAGVHNYTWWANDTLGYMNNTGQLTYTIDPFIDSIPPWQVNVSSPIEGFIYPSQSVLFNMSADDNVAIDTLLFGNGTVNYTYTVPVFKIVPTTGQTWFFYAIDTSGNVNNSVNRTFGALGNGTVSNGTATNFCKFRQFGYYNIKLPFFKGNERMGYGQPELVAGVVCI